MTQGKSEHVELRVGDEIEITVRGVVRMDDPILVGGCDLNVELFGHAGSYGFRRNHVVATVLQRAPQPCEIPAEGLVCGDMIRDQEDDWGVVVFNDTVGEQLLVSWEIGHLGRTLLPYVCVRQTRRPSGLYVQGGVAPNIGGLDMSDGRPVYVGTPWGHQVNRWMDGSATQGQGAQLTQAPRRAQGEGR